MRIYTVEQKQSYNINNLQANLRVIVSSSCASCSNSYSSKNTVDIDESKIKSIKIGGNFIAYLTTSGQVFAVYYNVKEPSGGISNVNANSANASPLPESRCKKLRLNFKRRRPDSDMGDSELKRKGSIRMKIKRSDSDVGGIEPAFRDHCYAQDISSRPKRRLTDDASTSTPALDLLERQRSHLLDTDNTLDLLMDAINADLYRHPHLRMISGENSGSVRGESVRDRSPSIPELCIAQMRGKSRHMPDKPRHVGDGSTSLGESCDSGGSRSTYYQGESGDFAGSSDTHHHYHHRDVTMPSTTGSSDEPEVSQPVQWLNSRNITLYFTMIAATKCAVLLVCSEGQLWRWDMLDNSFEEHPLYKTFCGDKAVVKLSSTNLRISVLLETGEVAVFYDSFISGGTPLIISDLSMPCEHILENEEIIDIKSADFLSAALTKSGKVYWWGMLQSESNKNNNSKATKKCIKSGTQVVLKNKSNEIPIGSLVYTSYPQSKLGRVEMCAATGVIVRLCDKAISTKCQESKVETWTVSQTIVLETTTAPLGTVIGIHGTNTIIMTSKHTDSASFKNEWKQYRRMFSEGQLDKLHDEDVDMETKKINEDNIMDIDSSSVASDASHANSSTSYPNLCVYPLSDLQVYESGGYSHKAIQKVPVNLFSSKHSNLDDFRALNLGIDYTGNITCLGQNKKTKDVYMLTKDGISDKCEAIRECDAGFLLAEEGKSLDILCTPDVAVTIDTNMAPFIPLITTRLNARETCYFPPINALAIKQELSRVPGSSRLLVAIAKQQQVALPAIIQGDLKYLMHLQSTATTTSPTTGSTAANQASAKSDKMKHTNAVTPYTWEDLIHGLETERDACGRTALHICCTAKPNFKKPTQKQLHGSSKSPLPVRVDDSYFHSITLVKRNYSFEELRFRHYTTERQKELSERDRWLNILKFICSIDKLQDSLTSLLTITDNAGFTPFLAAIASKNYSHAWYLLPLILAKDKDSPGLVAKAIWSKVAYGMTVYHLLAQGLINNILVIQSIPSWYSEQSLHCLFSQNYPSLYKVIIQQKPKGMIKSLSRHHFDITKPITVRDRILRSFNNREMTNLRSYLNMPHSSPQKSSSSQQLQGVLFFADPNEARKALIQMDGFVIPPRASNRYSGQYFPPYNTFASASYFELSVRFVEKEVRGYFFSSSKKRKSRIWEEHIATQEKYRRMLMGSLLKYYNYEVNDLCESPLTGIINEEFFGKIESRYESHCGTAKTNNYNITDLNPRIHIAHRFSPVSASRLQNILATPRTRRGTRIRSTELSHSIRRMANNINNDEVLQIVPIDGVSYALPSIYFPGVAVRGRTSVYTGHNEDEDDPTQGGSSFHFPRVRDVGFIGTVPFSSRYHQDEPFPSLPSESLISSQTARANPASHSVFSMSNDSGVIVENVIPQETSIDLTTSNEEQVAPIEPTIDSIPYELGLPITNQISVDENTSFDASQNMEAISRPLLIPDPGESSSSSSSGSNVYEEKEVPYLDGIGKQLCCDEKIVLTTVYCAYTSKPNLPSNIVFMLDASSSTLPDTPYNFTLQDIDETWSRANREVYQPSMIGFMHNLIAHTSYGADVASTLINMLHAGCKGALFISILFVKALTRYLTLQFTNIGPRECLEELPEYRFIAETKKLLTQFGWLAVYDVLQAGDALIMPLQYSLYKTQAHSTTTDHHIFPPPTGFVFPHAASQAISLHPSTYLRQCPLLKDRRTPTASRQRKLLLKTADAFATENEDELSSDEITDDEVSSQDDSNHNLLTPINFLDMVDNLLAPGSTNQSSGNTDEDPYLMWSVDGQTTSFRPVLRRQQSAEELALMKENSTDRGKNILACVFSRLVKFGADLSHNQEIMMCEALRNKAEVLIEGWWRWFEPILTSLDSQFTKASRFDLEKYSTMLKQGERRVRSMYSLTPSTTSRSSITSSFPQEYVMYLLDSHLSEASLSLPIIDIKSYKHLVYIYDTMYYVNLSWPKKNLKQETSVHDCDSSASSSSGISSCCPTVTPKNRGKKSAFLRRTPSLDFGINHGSGLLETSVLPNDLDRSVEVQLPLALQPHLLTPLAHRDSLFSSDISKTTKKIKDKGKESLRQAIASRSELLTKPTEEFLAEYDVTTRVFSKYFLGDGPGIEKDSILNLRACFSGKIARFVRQIKEMKSVVQAQYRHEMREIPNRIYNLHIYISRKRLLSDSIRCLLDMVELHPINYSVKFEGEEGGGPGVNRGWFSVVCTAMKEGTKYPDKTLPLFTCHGRIPEQSGIMSPHPWESANIESHAGLYKQRLEGFKGCGRFLGLALWFKQTLPFRLSRYVWKYLLGRKLCWADLAFYNADLYEGFRAMLNDAKWMTEEEFMEVYPCHFEVEVNGIMREFRENGSQISLTKNNVEEYIEGYSMELMVKCVEQELTALKAGFTSIIPHHILAGLTAEDLTLILSGGNGEISYERLYNIVTFANSIGCSHKRLEQFKRWFWKIVKDMSNIERQQLLYFATGSSTLPPLDHTSEVTRDRISITVDIQHDSRNALPMASTCGQRISIPLYRSFSMLKSKLFLALHCLSYGLG